jgi:hypothetical protein
MNLQNDYIRKGRTRLSSILSGSGTEHWRRQMHMILGVDPHSAKPFSWALLRVDLQMGPPIKLIKWSTGNLIALKVAMLGADEVVIEDQFLNKNYRTARELSKAAGEVSGIAKLQKLQVTWMNPATWRKVILGKNPTDVVRVGTLRSFGAERATKDEQDAIFIGLARAMQILEEYRNT